MPKKVILVVYSRHHPKVEKQIAFVEKTLNEIREDHYEIIDAVRSVQPGHNVQESVFENEAHRIIVFYSEHCKDLETQAAIFSGLYKIIETQRRVNLILICDPKEREGIPEPLKIAAHMSPGDSDALKAYIKTQYPLRGTLDMYNAGRSMAVGFVCGYVDFAYKDLREKMKQRSFYEQGRLSLKLHILCPKNYTMPDEGFADGTRIFLDPDDEDTSILRDGGVPKRIYNYNLYEVRDKDGTSYYAHAEYAVPLTSLKMMVGDRLLSSPPGSGCDAKNTRKLGDDKLLRNEMQKYIKMLKQLDKETNCMKIIEYDEKAGSEHLADLLVASIKEDLSSAADVAGPQRQESVGDDLLIQGDHTSEDICVLPVSKKAMVEMKAVIAQLEELEREGRVIHWADRCPMGGSPPQYMTDIIKQSKYFILLHTTSPDDNQNLDAQLLGPAIREALIEVTDLSGSASMVVVTDCEMLSDITSCLSPFFVKWIREWNDKGLPDRLRNALSSDIRAIEYLNIGHCLGAQFFYSYLNYKVPELETMFEDWIYKGKKIPQKLFIIIQESAKIKYPKDLEPDITEVTDVKPRTITTMRGGARRSYPTRFYRIQHENQDYYAMVEYIACIRSIENVQKKFNLPDVWLKQEVALFKETLSLVLRRHPELFKKIQVVEYDDKEGSEAVNVKLAGELYDLCPDVATDRNGAHSPAPYDGAHSPPPDVCSKSELSVSSYVDSGATTNRTEWSDCPSQSSLNDHRTCTDHSSRPRDGDEVSESSYPDSDIPVQVSHSTASADDKLSAVLASLRPTDTSDTSVDDDVSIDDLVSRLDDVTTDERNDDVTTDERNDDVTTDERNDDVTTDGRRSDDVTTDGGHIGVSVRHGTGNGVVEDLSDSEIRDEMGRHSEYRDEMGPLPRTSSRASLTERSRSGTLNRSEYSEDEFYDASEGNRTLGSIGDESYYQSVGDVSTQYFSDEENSDLSTLSPDDTPDDTPNRTVDDLSVTSDLVNSLNSSSCTAIPNLNLSRDTPPHETSTSTSNDMHFNQVLSDDSNFSSLEELPSVIRMSTEEPSTSDPRSRDWQPSIGQMVQVPSRTLATVVRGATKELCRELGEEALHLVGNELVCYLVDGI